MRTYLNYLLSFLAAGFCYNSFAETPSLTFRSRAASLQEGNQTGHAGSVRARFSWDKAWNNRWATTLEVDAVTELWPENFSNGVRFNGQPPLPDVGGADLNQASLAYDFGAIKSSIGRQVIRIDDERFVGSVSIWQNEQSYDALNLHLPVFSQSKVQYTYINKALRIFGRDAELNLNPNDLNFSANNGLRPLPGRGEHELKTHILWADFNEWDYSKFSLFYYDYKNEDGQILSNKTTGLIYKFNYRPNNLTYNAEIISAIQQRYKINNKPSSHFYRVELGLSYKNLSLALRQEKLGATRNGSSAESFITPMASLHDHQGWNDRFTLTPSEGIVDNSIRLLWRSSPWRADLRYHQFRRARAFNNSETREENFGSEIDLDIEFEISKRQSLHLRTAHFFEEEDYKDRFSEASRIMLTHTIRL